ALLRDQPGPAWIADLPIEPVAPLLARLASRGELLERRPRIGELLQQHEAFLAAARLVADRHAIGERNPDRGEAWQGAAGGEATAEDEARWRPDRQQGGGEREHPRGAGAGGVDAQHPP